LMSITYTVLTPFLSPIIYSLRTRNSRPPWRRLCGANSTQKIYNNLWITKLASQFLLLEIILPQHIVTCIFLILSSWQNPFYIIF
jgi:hypothetical protein